MLIFSTTYSGGLSAFYMAIQPLKNCEIAVGGGVNGGDGTPDGLEDDIIVRRWVAKALSVAKTLTRNIPPYCNEKLEIPIADLLNLSVALDVSGRGEVLGVKLMTFLCTLFEVGRHRVSEQCNDLMEKISDYRGKLPPFTVVHRLMKGHRILVW